MINSNYNIKNKVDPTIDLKKKLLKPKMSEEEPATSDEIQSMFKDITPKVDADVQKAKEASAITGGNYSEESIIKPIVPSVLAGDADEESSGKWGTGTASAKATSAATGALGMVGTVIANKAPMNGKERTANTMSLTTQGAQAGSAFGPLGTAIGATAGLATGLVMGIGDQKKLDAEADKEKLAMLDTTTNNRMKAQKLEEGKKIIAKNKAALEAQMGMIGSNYSQTKNT